MIFRLTEKMKGKLRSEFPNWYYKKIIDDIKNNSLENNDYKNLTNVIRGWYPLPISHLNVCVKKAIKISNFRLQYKQCYRNAKKLVLQNPNFRSLQREILKSKRRSDKVPFVYCEGIVESGNNYYAHGWVRDVDGIHHEITMENAPKIIMHNEYDLIQVYESVYCSDGFCDPDDPHWGPIDTDAIDGYAVKHSLYVNKSW